MELQNQSPACPKTGTLLVGVGTAGIGVVGRQLFKETVRWVGQVLGP